MTKLLKDLVKDIKNTPNFEEYIDNFILVSFQYLFGIETKEPIKLSLKQLLEIANIFSLSSDGNDKNLAYLIATYCWLIYKDKHPDIYSVVMLVFARIGNFPAQKLIKTDVNHPENNIFSELESKSREFYNKIPFIKNLILTDFQLQLWEYLENNKSISFSAPTSSGKSYILKKYSIKKLKEINQGIILYLLPSRALINETSSDLLNFLKEENMQEDVLITSIPTDKSNNNKIIYVLTQERATILIEQKPDINFDLVIVDEAQSIENQERGIILQNIINNILEQNKETPLIFSSPFVENLEIFKEIFAKNIDVIPNENSNVIQNLILVNVLEDGLHLSSIQNQSKEIGIIPLDISCYDISAKKNRLAYIAKLLTKDDEKSIIYANGPAEAEDIAQILYDQLKPIQMDKNLKELSTYIKKHLHNKFSLGLLLQRGVAFHYGNLPQSIRKSIEEEFKKTTGKIKYLVCTSTLLEGVNLPAKNIFIENPYKGKEKDDIPLSQHEFWNLAGRAGRLTKDFYGNVFLVNYSNWNNKVQRNKNKSISSALFNTINTKSDELINYIETSQIEGSNANIIKSSVNILYTKYKEDAINQILDNPSITVAPQIKEKINTSLIKFSNKISLPVEIIKMNPYVSAINQEKLYNYFQEKLKNNDLDSCLPKHPMSGDSLNLQKVFYRINNNLLPENQSESMKKRIREVVPKAIIWMKGLPINLMIKDYIDFREKESKRAVDINSCVRHILEMVEQDIRFKFSITSKCYNDILSYCYQQQNIEQKIEPIHLYLEMGACNQTMISLMGIGLSRPTAAAVEDKISNKQMNENEVYDWLKTNKANLQTFKITGLTLDEIKNYFN